ncbi:hypothetical protein ABVV53_00825 [Novosphingobium sp. RD2P27]|uniref:Uncharacterized protein n=1 Tax=Novosphingobium kalidii TaxID=3230299 RepID=A0ABV2CWN7_9SPHN
MAGLSRPGAYGGTAVGAAAATFEVRIAYLYKALIRRRMAVMQEATRRAVTRLASGQANGNGR